MVYFKNLSPCYLVKLEYMIWIIWVVWMIEFSTLSWRKAILKYSTLLYFFQLLHFIIEINLLADGTYEFIQEPDGDISEAQANIVELTEAPNSDSKEPNSTDSIDTTIGKTRCIILLFLNYTIQYYLLVHLSYWSWMKT